MADLFGVSGKVAIVSGAGHGIGRSSALHLAGAGAKVVLLDIKVEAATETQKEIEAAGGTALAVATDVRRREEVEQAVKLTLETYGRIDIGVNVVGGGGLGAKPVLEGTDEGWEHAIGMTIKSCLYCCQTYARVMRRLKIQGSIVNMGSLAGLRAADNVAAYGATKAAIMNLTQTLAVELAPHGIRVNAIAPGRIDTYGTLSQKALDLYKQVIPLGRPGTPDEVGGLVLVLASMSRCEMNARY